MKNYLILSLLLFTTFSCKNDDHNKQLKVFLTEWSKALESKSESVMGFYEAGFVFPKLIYDAAEGLQYSFNIDSILVVTSQDKADFQVTVPFELAYPDGTHEQGTIALTMRKTEKGFLIQDMSQELAKGIRKYSIRNAREASERMLRYDSILGGIVSSARLLSQQYDSVVYFTKVDDVVLFYVIRGSWENPYPYEEEKQCDGGNYTMGVVTAENKIIVPPEYSKIYNPNGSLDGMIEVEKNGARGLFRIHGGEFIPAEFEGIYPTLVAGAVAQVKKGDAYGWVDSNGKVSFDPDSHANKKLFQSPIESNSILEWEFKFPGPINLLIDPYENPAESNGVIVYPSYVRDFGIAKGVAHPFVILETSEYGMGMTDMVIKFEKAETLSDKFFGLIAFFMESGADARGYHSERNDLFVVDKNLNTVGHLEKLTENYGSQDPCGEISPTYKTLKPGLYESNAGHGEYRYYQVLDDGHVEQLKTDREYSFTKFALIDESYFDRCRWEGLDYEEGRPNVVTVDGVDLDVMRNEIFAEYGFVFKSPKWKAYFEAKPWYKPQYDNVDKFLTEKDKANINFILDYQRAHKGLEVTRDSINFGWAG